MKKQINAFLNRLGYHLTNLTVTQADMLRDPIFASIAKDCSPFTMTSMEKMYALYQSVRYLDEKKIEGDFVECGVWRGGSLMTMMLSILRLTLSLRDVVVFDLFDNADRNGNQYWQSIPQSEVEKNIGSTGYPTAKIEIHPGDVLQSLPCPIKRPIALLRLDTDLYETTAHTLEHLFPHVVKGGIVIIDDYGSHPEDAGRATDEFFARHQLKPFFHRIDAGGRLFIKE